MSLEQDLEGASKVEISREIAKRQRRLGEIKDDYDRRYDEVRRKYGFGRSSEEARALAETASEDELSFFGDDPEYKRIEVEIEKLRALEANAFS